MSFDEHDVCRVTNNGDKPVILGYNNRVFEVLPGKNKVVPVWAAIGSVGDPRASDQVGTWVSEYNNERGWIPDRASEIRRLRCRYGIIDGNDHTLNDLTGNLGIHVPDLDLELMEDGDYVKVSTVIQDPTGEKIHDTAEQAIDVVALKKALERNQRLLSQLLAREGEDVELGGEDDIPVDDPTEAIAKNAESKTTPRVKASTAG